MQPPDRRATCKNRMNDSRRSQTQALKRRPARRRYFFTETARDNRTHRRRPMRSTTRVLWAHDNHPHGGPDGLRQHTAIPARRHPDGWKRSNRNRSRRLRPGRRSRDGFRKPQPGGKHDGEQNRPINKTPPGKTPSGHSCRKTLSTFGKIGKAGARDNHSPRQGYSECPAGLHPTPPGSDQSRKRPSRNTEKRHPGHPRHEGRSQQSKNQVGGHPDQRLPSTRAPGIQPRNP